MGTDSASPPTATNRRPGRSALWNVVKWGTFGLVLAFVGLHARHLWGEMGSHPLRLRGSWLAWATLVSIAAWLPSAWYWRWMMSALGAPPAWPEALAAYYCGHLGKYVPGKAMALLIRTAMLRRNGVPAAVSGFAATMETLTYMAAGTATAVLLLPRVLDKSSEIHARLPFLADRYWQVGFLIAAVAGSLAGLALLSHLSVRMASRLKGSLPAAGALNQTLAPRVYVSGFVVFLAAWWLQGATLGLTLQAISDEAIDWNAWPLWTGTAAVALVGGFLAVFAPGGLGVREGLLMELLRTQVSTHEAVAAAVLFRAVSLAGELLASSVLWGFVRVRQRGGEETRPG
ncbi:MAG: lysylphosphatidylglycerol synthase transmembrane domain-containing protein [Planctomycetaceae bacterium]